MADGVGRRCVSNFSGPRPFIALMFLRLLWLVTPRTPNSTHHASSSMARYSRKFFGPLTALIWTCPMIRFVKTFRAPMVLIWTCPMICFVKTFRAPMVLIWTCPVIRFVKTFCAPMALIWTCLMIRFLKTFCAPMALIWTFPMIRLLKTFHVSWRSGLVQ